MICCTNNGNIYSKGNAGGIVGFNGGFIAYCTNSGGIIYNTPLDRFDYDDYNDGIGGIAGVQGEEGEIYGCTNNAYIECSNSFNNSESLQPRIGQILGLNEYSTACIGNILNGIVSAPELRIVNGFNQARWVSNGEVGLG